MNGYLRSGQVAAAAGVNPQTLRYYERRGLLDPPDRTLGGHRLYSEDAVTVLRIVKTAQRLGFTLDEVSDLLDVATQRHGPARAIGLQARAEVKLAEVERKISDLAVIREILREAISGVCTDVRQCAAAPTCPLPFDDVMSGEIAVGDRPEAGRGSR